MNRKRLFWFNGVCRIKPVSMDENFYSILLAGYCGQKHVFQDYQFNNFGGRMFYMNPGNPVFDAMLKVLPNRFREEMMKGTVLVSPEDHQTFLMFLVKSQITDNRPSNGVESVADETIHLVYDIRSSSKENLKRYIEIKGCSGEGDGCSLKMRCSGWGNWAIQPGFIPFIIVSRNPNWSGFRIRSKT